MSDNKSAVESAYDDGDLEGAVAAAEAMDELEEALDNGSKRKAYVHN